MDIEFMQQWRDSLLQLVDALERQLQARGVPLTRTAELRKEAKRGTNAAQGFERNPIKSPTTGGWTNT